ncbi:chaplin family protein [Streptomyces sp. NPDC002018]|uniref:chaplin n=1 Tax=Streptomyces sp. NPDC002018 TaxID=3364629 RepID=UPI0036C3F0D9
MRQVTRKGLITVAAAGGVLALGGGHAHADSGAEGTAAKSPGVLSGNTVQVPVHVPVNVCGNTVDVVGVLNPAFGNGCANGGGPSSGAQGGSGTAPGGGGSHQGGSHHGGGSQPGATDTVPGGGSHAEGGSANSPGVGSGNTIEVPIEIPVNVCGNSVSLGGLLNPATGNGCENDAPVAPPVGPEQPGKPVVPVKPEKPTQVRIVPPSPEPRTVTPPEASGTLARTGAGGLGIAVPVGAGLLLAGSLIYRRARAAA